MIETVTDYPKWRTVLHDWKAHKWSADNVPGMIDKYNNGSQSARAPNGKPAPKPGKKVKISDGRNTFEAEEC